MKKIITAILFMVSTSVYASMSFNVEIPVVKEVLSDFDGDGIPNHMDNDSDNDGIPNAEDKEQFSPEQRKVDIGKWVTPSSEDHDGDGILNDVDTDDDGDGIPDSEDTKPYSPVQECDGFYTSGMIIGDFKFTYANITLTNNVPDTIGGLFWKDTSINIPDSSNVPDSEANSISSNGYKYWYNVSSVLESGWAMSAPDGNGGWVSTQTIYYGVCRIAE